MPEHQRLAYLAVADSKQDSIRYLIERRFPPSPIVRAIRQERKTLRPVPDAIKETIDAAMAYRVELSKLPQSELAARCAEEKEKEIGEILDRAKREEETRVFNQPYARADFEYWAKTAHWSLDEAIALSFGKAPEHVNWKAIEPLVRISPFAHQYQRRRELALRAVPWKQLFDPVTPGIFLDWAKKLQIAVPPELEAAVSAVGVGMTDWKVLYDDLKAQFEGMLATFEQSRATSSEHQQKSMGLLEEFRSHTDRLLAKIEDLKGKLAIARAPAPATEKTIGARERDSLLKLAIGMAVCGYGYDPTAVRSGKPAEITSDLASKGVPLDDGTVRKWLKEAAELLPPEDG